MARSHILNDKSKFINCYKDFDSSRHIVELANASKYNNLALKRGDACVRMANTERLYYVCNRHLMESICNTEQ